MKSRVKIKVKGLNQERNINNLSKDVKIYKVNRIKKNVCEFEVDSKHAKSTTNFLKSNNFEIVECSHYGFKNFMQAFFKSYGIIAALIVCIAFYIFQFGFILQIKIFGTSKLKNLDVQNYVERILPSKNKSKIDTKKVEVELKKNFPRISSVSVAITGQSLIININESVLPEEMEKEFPPVTANFDCIITSIELIQGTVSVKVGDIVQRGDVLVEPFIISSTGEKMDVRAQAIIKGDVWIVGKSQHSESYVETKRTGKSYQVNEVMLYGLPIYAKEHQCIFKQYEKVETLEDLSHNNILPLKIKRTIYYETETEIIEKSFEQVEQQKIQEAHTNALQFVEDCEIIKSENVNIKHVAGIYNVDYVLTIEREVGVVKNAS